MFAQVQEELGSSMNYFCDHLQEIRRKMSRQA
jgi:hypothetical protein